MMKGVLNILHPTFDALSAYADLSELDGARTRVGRHVARCARCREVVNEIRGLGAAARESETEGAPNGLWTRIETAAVEAAKEEAKPRETPAPDAVCGRWRRRFARLGTGRFRRSARSLASAAVSPSRRPRSSRWYWGLDARRRCWPARRTA